jgi:NitT/TauT family transport system permease protein
MRMDSAVRKREEPAQEGAAVLVYAPPQAEPQVATTSAPAPTPAPTPASRRWRIPPRYRGQAIAILIGTASLLATLVLWYLLTKYRVVFYVRFTNVPSPEQVFERAVRALSSQRFYEHIFLSCRRIFIGFAGATVVAVPLGLAMGRFARLRQAVFPLVEVLRPIPAIAWVPMAIMLWPTNEESIVFITFLGAFFPILLNTLHGMAMVDKVFVRAAQCLGATEAAIFREVYFPASLPHVFTGLAVGMGVAWVSLIAAEMISGQFGIGYFTWEAYSLVQYPDIALGMITIGVLGLASSALIRGLGHVAIPWGRS